MSLSLRSRKPAKPNARGNSHAPKSLGGESIDLVEGGDEDPPVHGDRRLEVADIRHLLGFTTSVE